MATRKATSEPKRRKEILKEESMRIRISKPDKELLEAAAQRLGVGISAYVLAAALGKARSELGK